MLTSHLFKRRIVWFPTWLGFLCILSVVLLPIVWWFVCGEAFLSSTQRIPAELLVVEGWIGGAGLQAAAAEFRQGGYQYVVTTGGLTSEGRWDFAEVGEEELRRCGVPPDRILIAHSRDVQSQRTYESAASVRQLLEAREVKFNALNVFTLGVHARRSHIVFGKVFSPAWKLGVIAWEPPAYKADRWWWHSTDRSDDFIKETVGILFEVTLNPGRRFVYIPERELQKSNTVTAR